MSYWKSYRKFRSEASTIAARSSSEEGDAHGDCVNSKNDHESDNDSGNTHQSNVMYSVDSSNKDSQENISIPDCSVFEDTESDDLTENNDASPPVSPAKLQQKLATWASKNNCQRGAVNELLGILREEGHTDLPKDCRTLLATPRVISTSEKCGGQYYYIGIEQGVCEALRGNPSLIQNNKTIKLKVNVDGLPLFKSSSAQFWPILGCFDNSKVFVIALWYGGKKPTSVEEYLGDFLVELEKLRRDGLIFESHKLCLSIQCFLCDAPARGFLKCIVGHTGYYACERCIIKGSWNGRVVFNCNELRELRTEENFSNLAYTNHQKEASPLIDHGISCIHRFPLDYMHLVCLGVTKRLLQYMKGGPKQCKLSSRHIEQISKALVSLHGSLPSEFARQPRSLVELDRWKATEYRQFLLYTGPIVLRDVIPKMFIITFFHCL